MQRTVDIIILTWDTCSLVRELLVSLMAESSFEGLEVSLIIIDQNSKDGTRDFLKSFQIIKTRFYREIKIIFNEKNTGFAGGVNQGLKISNSEYKCLLNSDTVIEEAHPDWLIRLVSFLVNNPQCGIVGPRSNCACGKQQECFSTDKPFEVESLSGFCMVFHKKILDEVGGFDERFSYGLMEDRDFSKRVRLKGYKLYVVPQSFVFHYGSCSFKEHNLSTRGVLKEENVRRYKEKWNRNWQEVISQDIARWKGYG